jgi:trehalose 6-phosphate phosphatase
MTAAEGDPQLDLWADPVNELAIEAMRELSPIGVRREEKGAIAALHWRGATDETAAHDGLQQTAQEAVRRGLAVHWGRKVLELRPPVPFDKGRAIERLVTDRINDGGELKAVIYAGDDTTDLDAFAAIDRMVDTGLLEERFKVAVMSGESPSGLAEAADVVVDGPEGVANLLNSLLQGPSD